MTIAQTNYSHLKNLYTKKYITKPHNPITATFCQVSMILNPSKEILRMAVLKWVSGNNLHNVCIHSGKTLIEKNVPDKSICGKANKFINNGIVESLLTMLEKISATPISTNNNSIERNIISINVTIPFDKVKPKKYLPTIINTTTLIN